MTPRIQIDFAQPSAFAVRHLTAWGSFGLLLALGMTLFLMHQASIQKEKLAELTTSMAKQDFSAKKPVKPKANFSVEEVQYAAGIADELSIPWNPLLTSLEQLNVPDVALLSLEPNRKKQEVVITGQAKHITAALQYVRALDQSGTLAQAHLLNHHIELNDPNKPLSFTIVAQWKK